MDQVISGTKELIETKELTEEDTGKSGDIQSREIHVKEGWAS